MHVKEDVLTAIAAFEDQYPAMLSGRSAEYPRAARASLARMLAEAFVNEAKWARQDAERTANEAAIAEGAARRNAVWMGFTEQEALKEAMKDAPK